jgi:formate hydrogenlyase subunit 3/multisubunit Na+/H+ antiporter MnhD subunit
MSVLLLAALTLPGGLAAYLTFGRPRVSLAIGGLTAILAIGVAATIGAQDTVPLAGTVVSGSDGLRTIALTWAAGLALLGFADALVGTGGATLGPSLIGLGTGVVALSVADAGIGFALLTASGLVTALAPLAWLRGSPNDRAQLGLRLLRPLAAAGLIGLMAVAWGASAAGPFAALEPIGGLDPGLETAIGLGLLVVVGAVALRMGAIPAHIWAARFAESGPVAAIPATLGWGAAGFALVALGWVDVTIAPAAAPLISERNLITVLAASSVLLGGLAAILHDDIEHILFYSIVQDAGIALLAFGVIRPDVAAAGRDWLIGMVAVKSGLAGWVLVTHSTFGARRLSELRGWARSSPILGVGLVIVLAGAIGLPGMASFAARGLLTEAAIATPFNVFVLLAAFAPLVYIGRILLVGMDRMSDAVRSVETARPRLRGLRPEGWTGTSVASAARAAPDVLRTAVQVNRFALAAASAVLVAAIGLGIATAGLGSAASDQPRGADAGATLTLAGGAVQRAP